MEENPRGMASAGDDAVASLLALRQTLYALTARAFAAEPDDAFAAWCATEGVREAVDFLAQNCEGAIAAIDGEALAVSVARSAGDRTIGTEYTKLFVGPGAPLAPPWESVYRNADGLLFQASTLAVRRAYRAAGFAAAGYPHEPDDHLGTELGFMEALAASTLRAWEAGDLARVRCNLQHQATFLEEHLAVWVGAFRDRVAAAVDQGAAGGFYLDFAKIACLLVAHDDGMIDEAIGELGKDSA